MKKKRWMLSILLAGLLLAGCGGMSEATEGVSRETAAMYDTSVTYDADMADSYEVDGTTEEATQDNMVTDTSGIETPVDTSQKLIKTVTLNMETKEFDTLLSGIQAKVSELGGYTESSYINGNSYYESGNRTASLTLRIPVEQLDTFVTTVSGLGNVTSKNESVEDVTLQYVDTESHKKALETEQERLLTLMEQAENVDDIITIETRLSEIRYELQNYESTLRTYDNQVSYSTVNLNLYEVERESSPEKQSFIGEIKSRLAANFYHIGQSLKSFAIWFIASLPYFVLLAALIFLVVKILRKIVGKKRIFHKKKDPEEPKS